MDDRVDALKALLEAVETETVSGATPHCDLPTMHLFRAYIGSLDAAKRLHEAVLPGWYWQADEGGAVVWRFVGNEPEVFDGPEDATDPARAWLIAILRTLISEAEK